MVGVEERQGLLRRLAEIAEQKLVDQVAAFEWWAKAVKEDPSSELALDELLRLVRSTHQWDAFVATMTEAASADRPPQVRHDVLLRLAASFEGDLGDLERAEQALVEVLGEHPKDPAALASLDRIYETQGMYDNLSAVLQAADRDHRRRPTSWSSCTCAWGASTPRRSTTSRARSRATWRCSSTSRARKRRSRRWSGSTSAASAGPSCTASTRSWSTSRRTTPTMAECYSRMAKLATDALDQREKAVELWGRVVDLRGKDTIALSGLADLHEAAGEWKELTEILEQQVAATEDVDAKIPIYKRLGRIWGEKLSRERNSLESWQKVLELDPQDVDALRAIAENYKSAGAWEELSQALRRLIQVAPARAAPASATPSSRSCTRSWASSRARPSCARRRRSTPGARCWSSTRTTSARSRRWRSCSRRRRAGKSASRSSSGARRRWPRRPSRSTC